MVLPVQKTCNVAQRTAVYAVSVKIIHKYSNYNFLLINYLTQYYFTTTREEILRLGSGSVPAG